MSRKLRKATRSWLEAERLTAGAGSNTPDAEKAAENALVGVFRALPMPAPSPALAGRTLAQLAQLGLVSRVRAAPHWAYRWAVTVALTLSGLASVLYAPVLLGSLSLRGSSNWMIDLGAGILAAGSRRLAAGYTLWDVIARAGATSAGTIATPQFLGLMLVTVLFGLATLRVLAGLVAVERSSYHA